MASLLKMELNWSISRTGKGGATAGRASEKCSGRQSSNVKAGLSWGDLCHRCTKKKKDIDPPWEKGLRTMARKLFAFRQNI